MFGKENIEKDNEKIVFSEIKDLHHQLTLLNQYILFKCDFSQNVILPVIHMIEKNIETQLDHFSTKRNLYHCTVEILQNMSHHGLFEDNKKTGIFSFGKNKDGYVIKSINLVNPEGKLKLENRLNDLSGNSKSELNSKYRNQIKTKISESNPTPGLGLIDLARISKKWDFEFRPVENENFLFDLRVVI